MQSAKRLGKPLAVPSREKGWGVLSTLALLVLLLLVGIVIYAAYRQSGRQLNVDGKGEIKKTVDSVRDASENAVTTSKVKTALALSKNVSAFDIDVDSD